MAPRAPLTHCIHGHEFTPENTYQRKDGKRQCRECSRLRKGIGTRQQPPRCRKNHLLTGSNVSYRKDGYRECRVCARLRKRKEKLVEVTCPDCGVTRVLRADVSDAARCRANRDFPCGSCAQKRRFFGGSALVAVPDDGEDYETFWRERFTQREINELWAAVSLYLDLDFLEKEKAA